MGTSQLVNSMELAIKNINCFSYQNVKMSCEDYKSKMMLFAKCCDKYVCCWVCHNSEEDHTIIFVQEEMLST